MKQTIPSEQIQSAKRVDLVALAGARTNLRRSSGNEYAGPCPKCGGEDRFHVTATWWFCRQCHTKRSDAIGLVRWLDGYSFAEAVHRLSTTPTASTAHAAHATASTAHAAASTAHVATPQRPQRMQTDDWRHSAARRLRAAQVALNDAAGNPWSEQPHVHSDRMAVQYLRKRKLTIETAQRYGLGCCITKRPNTERRDLAVAIPWYGVDDQLTALRYRFVPVDGDAGLSKLSSESGSRYSGLYGRHALTRWASDASDGRHTERLRTLVLVEGELNAMSIAQVAGGVGQRSDWRLDVVSLGSESQRLTDDDVAFCMRYGRRLAWLDKRSVAGQIGARIDAEALASPNEQDANDLLQSGLLAGFLASVLVNGATSAAAVEGVLWSLWDSAAHGVDVMTASVIDTTARRIGRTATLVEGVDGLWWQKVS